MTCRCGYGMDDVTEVTPTVTASNRVTALVTPPEGEVTLTVTAKEDFEPLVDEEYFSTTAKVTKPVTNSVTVTKGVTEPCAECGCPTYGQHEKAKTGAERQREWRERKKNE